MAAPVTHSPSATINGPAENALVRVRAALEGGQLAAALVGCDRLLVSSPAAREPLYLRAVTLRYLGRLPEALATLSRLEGLHPTFARLYQERGHCAIALRDASLAIESFGRAVNLNPALIASWQKLEAVHRLVGDTANAALAAAHVRTLGAMAPAVVTASALYYDGDVDDAEDGIRAYLLTQPTDIEGMRLLARIAAGRDALEDADFLYETVLEIAPDYQAARYEYASVLMRRHRYAKATAEIGRLRAADPDNRTYRIAEANAAAGAGDHARALHLYRELCADMPRHAELLLSIAHSEKTLGRQAEAIGSYREAAALRQDFGDAYWSLANLKTYRFTDAEIATMQARFAATETGTVDRYHLAFALGKALEDRGEYHVSFDYYRRGNALKRAEIRYDAGVLEDTTRRQQALCDVRFFAERQGYGCEAADPIFIVGLPRAGSTLLEQILASHSMVEGTMELADVPLAVSDLDRAGRRTNGVRYPEALAHLSAQECRRLGEKYLASTRIYRAGKPFFIDKMPNNFRHIALVHLMLPNAKIIDARREPMACCFGIFKQLFAAGQEFSYSFDDIARYYALYRRLTGHWDRVLPGRVLRVEHESVVMDLEGNVRRLLGFCGLPFEEGCLEFHKTSRSVRTASSEQVRQPIYREGLTQWEHFVPSLAPLRDALISHGVLAAS